MVEMLQGLDQVIVWQRQSHFQMQLKGLGIYSLLLPAPRVTTSYSNSN